MARKLSDCAVLVPLPLAFGFIAQSDLTAEQGKVETATAAKLDAESRFEAANEVKRDVSEILGWYDRESADPESDVTAATAALVATVRQPRLRMAVA